MNLLIILNFVWFKKGLLFCRIGLYLFSLEIGFEKDNNYSLNIKVYVVYMIIMKFSMLICFYIVK